MDAAVLSGSGYAQRVVAHNARAFHADRPVHGRSPTERSTPDITAAALSRSATGAIDFRQPRPIGGTHINHAFTGFARDADGNAWARVRSPTGEIALWAGAGYRWMQIFTGDSPAEPERRQAIAIEPMTCPPNSFVTGQDLITLDPGQRVSNAWGLTFVQR